MELCSRKKAATKQTEAITEATGSRAQVCARYKCLPHGIRLVSHVNSCAVRLVSLVNSCDLRPVSHVNC